MKKPTKKPRDPKLPRKRKKAYVKVRGRQNYLGMRKFLAMEGETKFGKEARPIINSKGVPDFKTEGYW